MGENEMGVGRKKEGGKREVEESRERGQRRQRKKEGKRRQRKREGRRG